MDVPDREKHLMRKPEHLNRENNYQKAKLELSTHVRRYRTWAQTFLVPDQRETISDKPGS